MVKLTAKVSDAQLTIDRLLARLETQRQSKQVQLASILGDSRYKTLELLQLFDFLIC